MADIMTEGTLNIIKAALSSDSTVTAEQGKAILGFCLNPVTNQMVSIPIKYLSPNTVADHLDISLRTIQRWVKDKTLKSVKIGTARRIPSTELDRLILPDKNILNFCTIPIERTQDERAS